MKKVENFKYTKELENNLAKAQELENTKIKVSMKLLSEANEQLKEGINKIRIWLKYNFCRY